MDQKIHQIFSPNKILFGLNATGQIGIEAKAMGGIKALIVTDPGIVNSGLIDPIRINLEKEGLKVLQFGQCEPEPPAEIIDEGVHFAKESGVDLIVGVGGGSSLDVAKGISVFVNNPGKTLDYCGIEMIPNKGIQKILVPTTAGTGSEVTRSIIVVDRRDSTKKTILSRHIIGDLSIVDPMLTCTMPPKVTVDTGMDALVHAIEAFVSLTASPFSDLLASDAIRTITKYLPVAFAKGENMEARYNMSLGALFAGLAFASGGLGAVHGLAYPLSTEYHLSHGRANAVMLPHVMEFNLIGSHSRYAAIAEMMGNGEDGKDIREKASMAVHAVKRLLGDVQVSCRLRDYGIPEEAIPRLVDGGMNQARLFGRNPRNLTGKDIEGVYRKAW